jgi:hypothetical protein
MARAWCRLPGPTPMFSKAPMFSIFAPQAMGKIAALQVEQKLLVYPQIPETAPTVL